MRRFLLDTGTAGAFINRRQPVRGRAEAETARGNVVGLCVPGLAELRYGAEFSDDPPRSLQRLAVARAKMRVWPFGEPAAAEYGRLFADLRRRGRPMQQVDVMIAAIARVLGNCTVVTMDSDFSRVPGLTVEDWSV